MENLMEVYFKKSKSILNGLLCFTYVGMFLSIRVGNIPLIALIVFCATKIHPKECFQAIKGNSAAKILIAIYFLYIIGLLYTSNLAAGFFQLERKIVFVLFPVFVLPILIKENLDINNLLKQIGYITLASSIIMLGIAAYKMIILCDADSFYFENFTPIHYVAYAMYFGCGSLFLIDSLFNELKGNRRIAVITSIFIYSLAILVLVASKTGLVIFVFTAIIFLYMKLRSRRVFWLCLGLFIGVASILLYFNQTTVNRFSELNKYLSVLTQEGPIKDVEVTDLNMRLLFWKISLSHAWRDNLWLTGVGPGDAQDYLDALYTLPNYMLYGYVGWNSHNQWVYFLIQLGLLPVFLFALLYGTYFSEAMRESNFKLMSFLFITLGFSLSECFLERNKGIMFFCLTLTILSISKNNKR